MAQRNPYRSNGSAAYDIYAGQNMRSNALPKQRPAQIPDAPARPRRAPKVRTKPAFSPFALLGGAMACVMLFLVIFSYVRLYETKSEVGELQSELSTLSEQKARLQSQYEGALDLEKVEKRAKELNMRKPGPSQIVYVQVQAEDTAEVYTAPKEQNIFQRAFTALRNVFTDAVEYFT